MSRSSKEVREEPNGKSKGKFFQEEGALSAKRLRQGHALLEETARKTK